MLPKNKINQSTINNDEDSLEQPIHGTPIDLNNELREQLETPKEDLKIVFIPKNLHEHFECVLGKHIFIETPWTKIAHKKIIEHLQLQKENSCFWEFRKNLESIKNENVLVGYKPFSKTGEEFLICTTDEAIQYIEETQIKIEHELKQKLDRSMFRIAGPWESKNSEKDIEDIKPVETRDKITYKWKIPAERLQTKAKFEDSNLKFIKNEYVKLEPRSKEIFESSDMLTIDSSVQAVRKMVNSEMQTIPRIKNNKCIQSVAVEEEMFQLQPIIKSEKILDDFLEKHVPNLVEQLHYNELYELYRDDYKLLNNENKEQIEEKFEKTKLLYSYGNALSEKKYVSCHTWHPTIPGVFAISYMTNSNALYKSVNLELSTEDISKSTNKNEKYDNSYSDDENNQIPWNNQLDAKLVDDNYKEKITILLNKEFVQRMRIIQITEDEKTNEQYDQNIIKQLRNSFEYISHEQPSIYKDLPIENSDYETLIDEDTVIEETQEIFTSTDSQKNVDKCNESNLNDEFFMEKNESMIHNTKFEDAKVSSQIKDTDENEYLDEIDHHDSDTESFYNIWGDDEEWMYGNKLRNVVRNIHREFNKKYDREAREDKLFNLLKSEAKYTEKKNKIENIENERMKLTKDMFKAGDMCQRLKNQQEFKSKIKQSSSKQNKHYKVLQNDEEFTIKREKTSLIDQQNNSVVIWSINDWVFPKLRLESPEEVCCVEFNPRNGNTIVGGLINGQICIWDISGKLETIDSNNKNTSIKEKKHHNLLWMHMKWSLDVNFETRVRPAALSAILESHDSMVTAIQWIHPMNEITPLGKIVTIQEERFSNQFFSASMDGTIKLWNLNSPPQIKTSLKNKTTNRFGFPKNLNNYKSPLSIYHNCLKPSYTITIKEPESTNYSPITALSFEIPLIQYNCISNQPLIIGKRQFEYAPTITNDPNRILMVGSIMGQIGVVTWNGYDTYQPNQNQEDCKHIWWGHIHDGPINCIKRNVFFPDIHLVCGGHVVSIWSLNYKNGPIWWKKFMDYTNSVLWSIVHPAEFRISFNTSGILQFWNLLKDAHQQYYTFYHVLGSGLIATLSAPHPPIHFMDTKHFKFAEGIHEVMDTKKNELISFSNSAGDIIMFTINATILKPDEIEDIRRVFQREIIWRRELDSWNDKYIEEFGSIGENDVDDHNYVIELQVPSSVQIQNVQSSSTLKQTKRKIYDETFKWYVNRRGPQTRLGKLDEKYIEREKKYMIEAMLKKKNVTQKQLEDYFKEVKEKKYKEDEITKIRLEADETYRDIVNKLLAAEHIENYEFDTDSKKSTNSDEIKNTFEKIHQLLVTDIVIEKEKLNDYINKNPYKTEPEDWSKVIEFSEREIRDRLNDPTLFKGPALRVLRRKLAKKYIDEGYKIKELKNRKNEHACDRYRIRENKIKKLKAMYGKNYNPYWDKDLEPQKIKDAIRMRITNATNENYEQSFDNYFEDETGDKCYDYYQDFETLDENNQEEEN